ncbi:MAG: AI-2E family transporter [Pseudomonadota bacterium]
MSSQEITDQTDAVADAPPLPGPPLGLHLSEANEPVRVALKGPARLFFSLGLTVLIGYILVVGANLMIPLITAAFLSFLIFTLKENFRRIPGVGKYVPDPIAYLLAFAAIFGVIFIFADIVAENVALLIDDLPAFEDRFRDVVQEVTDFAARQTIVPAEAIKDALTEVRARAVGLIQPTLAAVAGSARAMITNAVVIFLYTAFILVERARIFRKIGLLSKDPKRRHAIDETIKDIGVLVRQYLTVKTLSNTITAGASLGIMLAMDIKYAGFWALAIFALNYIPIFGAASAISLPVIMALVQPGGGLDKMLVTLGLLIGAEQIMSNIIEPRIVGKSLNLSPLVILIALAVWGSIWGFAGFLLAVPMTVCVMLILTQFEATRPLAVLMSDEGEIAELKHPAIGG